MPSHINPAFPVHGNPTTDSVRDNFEHARDEINDLESDFGQLETEAVKLTPTGGISVTGDIACQKIEAHGLSLSNVGVHGLHFTGVPEHIDNAAAHAAGMQVGDVYRDLLGFLRIVY